MGEGREAPEAGAPAHGLTRGLPAGWAAIALVVGLVLGVPLGVLIADQHGAGNGGSAVSPAALPAACSDALDAARQEFAARAEALAIPDRLSALLDQAGRAIGSFDTAELDRILTDLERLGRRARAAAQELNSNGFEISAQACEAGAALPS
jgi:hypothetical protein